MQHVRCQDRLISRYVDANLPLFGLYSIVGRAIVLHDTSGASWICCKLASGFVNVFPSGLWSLSPMRFAFPREFGFSSCLQPSPSTPITNMPLLLLLPTLPSPPPHTFSPKPKDRVFAIGHRLKQCRMSSVLIPIHLSALLCGW